MKTSRKIVFWALKRRPSFLMRGAQVAQALSELGYRTEMRYGPSFLALHDVKDSVLICIKSCPSFPWWLAKRNNKIVYDAIDYTPLRGLPNGVHAVIAGTDYMKQLIEQKVAPNTLVKTIYHHADPKLSAHHAGEKELRLVYNGELDSSKFIHGEIPELKLLSFRNHPNWREELRDYNAHFSARLDMHKAVVKLANVASLGAVYLTGEEPGCLELLGNDYPFFIKNPHELEAVRQDVSRLKASIGTQTWKDARDRIEKAKSHLTLGATARYYEQLILDIA